MTLALIAYKPSRRFIAQISLQSQCAKKVVSDSPGLVDFAIGLVNSLFNFPKGLGKIFRRIKIIKVL